MQLGAELISSDAVAFYELIKNAFDAGSPRAEISVVCRISHDSIVVLREMIADAEEEAEGGNATPSNVIDDIRDLLKTEVDPGSPGAADFARSVEKARALDELKLLLDEANYIDIQDTGEGMSLDDLSEVYLTIGTRSRLEQREQQKSSAKSRPILGEKGLGRLSTMRLGSRLRVITSRTGEARWNVLEVDWGMFSHESDKLIEEIPVTPHRGDKKTDPALSGTTIHISGLESGWSRGKLEQVARDEFSRLTDPFVPRSRYPITVRFNGNVIPIPSFDKLLFQYAHAIVNARLRFDVARKPHLVGSIDYTNRKREKTFELDEVALVSITKSPSIVIEHLGPFALQFYWFNRRLLTKAEGVLDHERVKNLVNQWAGGLMVYRDGFRVHPYGSPEDDWLSLDRKALAAPGYKVNRRQVMGKVDISASGNPRLVDQTNREGLRDNEEKAALVAILQHILTGEFRTFLDAVDADVNAREVLSFDEVEERVVIQEKRIDDSLLTLVKRHPEVTQDKEVVNAIQNAADNIRGLMKEASQMAEEYEKGRTQLVHLAGLGLMVEIIGHELNRATAHAIRTLDTSDKEGLPPNVISLFSTLKEQLRTIEKRLRVLDPLSTSGRQVKEPFDLISWVSEILTSHRAQFERHRIKYDLRVEPETARPSLMVKAVKGMFVQILENLISNSVYWLKQQQRLDRAFRPQITVVVDVSAREVRFTDNGPGISPARRDEVFQPFVTTKPPGEGKGLGLYISREIAEYNGASLYLSDDRPVRRDSLHTFVLALESKNNDGNANGTTKSLPTGRGTSRQLRN
ncbi:MAG: sensor histidine kinase [Chitinophagaceae bacterium]